MKIIWISLVMGFVAAAPAAVNRGHLTLGLPVTVPMPTSWVETIPQLPESTLDPRERRQQTLLKMLNGKERLTIFEQTLECVFTASADGKSAKLSMLRPLSLASTRSKQSRLVARYRPGDPGNDKFQPGLYVFRVVKGRLDGPVTFGEEIDGKFLGLGRGRWAFSSPNSGLLTRLPK